MFLFCRPDWHVVAWNQAQLIWLQMLGTKPSQLQNYLQRNTYWLLLEL
jgi:hypothetical protein